MKKLILIVLLFSQVILFSTNPEVNLIHDQSAFRILLSPSAFIPESKYFSSTDVIGLTYGNRISDKLSFAIFTVPPFAFSLGYKYQLYSNNNLNISTGGALWVSYEEIDLGETDGTMFIYSQQLITTFGNKNNALNIALGINPYREDGEKNYLPINCNIGAFYRLSKHVKLIGETSIIEIVKSDKDFRIHDIFLGGFRFFWKKSTLDLTIGKYDSEISWEDNIIFPMITYTKYF